MVDEILTRVIREPKTGFVLGRRRIGYSVSNGKIKKIRRKSIRRKHRRRR